MTPLDLTQATPRSPRVQLRGLCMLPRMIDIARAMLSGGNVGEYQIGRGFSAHVLAELGINVDQFIRVVATAADDEDVASRLLKAERHADYVRLSAKLERITVADVSPERRPDFERFYGDGWPSDMNVFDVLTADDANSFPLAGHLLQGGASRIPQ